ncbi:beta strand repeat-containing protein [Edaphobacter flagellatus]|uniref:beta strand repeat-containing protein n=1 Tax=Edaphobacter flagellatus TaxID=1933044 RepID=UPI0021B4066D|nr:FG-GAP-like repeat-containing protein [Edaphobacter flagellatus]
MLNRLTSCLRSSGLSRALSGYFQPTAHISRRQRIASALLFACLSYIIMGDEGCGSCGKNDVIDLSDSPTVRLGIFTAFGLGYALPFGNARPGLTAKLTGSDGSQTGTASFLGNFTAITQPSGNYFLMNRAADCSLNLATGSSALTGRASISGITTNYERTLHQLAQLTTTPDTYPLGCGAAPGGLSTRPAVVLPKKANSAYVFAAIAGNTSSNAVFILTPSSDLTTASFNALTSLPNATALTTADFNGDGNGDLLVVNAYNASSAFVSVVIGNGDGTFQNPVSYPTAGSMSVAAVVDDINNDGKPDLIVASDDQNISVLTGKGDGTFNAAQSFSAPLPGSSTPTSTPIVNLITADVNGDGKKDIICSNGLVLLGKGDGTFTPVSTPAFPYATATSGKGPNLAAGDINKDGKMDLVLNTGNVISIWLGKGDGTFAPGASYSSIANTGFVTATDLDGDGNLDIYSGLSNSGFFSGDDSANAAAYVLMGKGDGTLVGAPVAPGAYTGANLADVNGDGYPDLIIPTSGTVNGQNTVFTVQLGSASGVFTKGSTITVPTSVTFTVSEFTSPVTENTSNLTPSSYALGDINGDGKADAVYVSNYRGYSVYFVALNNGDGTFAAATATGFPQIASTYDNATSITSLRIADFNHDGKNDLAAVFDETAGGTTGSFNRGIAVLPGNGNGTFGAIALTYTATSSTPFTSSANLPQISSTADVNNNGLTDIVARSSSFAVVNGVGVTTSYVQVFLAKPDGTFAAPVSAITTTYLGQITVADFNKDGKLDIAALTETSSSQAQLAIALGNGDGTFATPKFANLAGGDAIRSSGLASADFDNDGKIDLALLDSNDFGGLFYGNGDGTFTSVPYNSNIIPKDLISIATSGTATALDLNKDGKPDILVGQTVLLNIVAPKVTQYATTIALSSSATTINPGAGITLTATVTGASGSTGTPTGTVTFLDGTTSLGTGTLSSGTATLATSALTASGSHSITAVYGGDTSFASSTSSAVSITVNAASIATTTTLSASPTSTVTGTSIALAATVTAASGSAIPSGTVTFFDGTTTLGTGTLDGTGKGTFSTSSLVAGSHSITAKYAGTTTFGASTSTAVTVTITAPVSDFAISLSSASGTETKSSPASATVTVTPSNGFNSTVAFSCSGLPSGVSCAFSPLTVTPSGGAASTTTVTFSATSSAATRSGPGQRYTPGIVFTLSIGAWLLIRGRSRRLLSASLWTVLAAGALYSISGCGGSGAKTTTSIVTITATSGSLSRTASYTLTSTN